MDRLIRLDRLVLVVKALRETHWPQAFMMCRIHTCGTPHCAFGNYVARRDLQQTFQFPTWENAERIYRETHGNLNNVVLQGVWGATQPVFHWRRSLEHHFGLTEVQVELIFGSTGCNDAETADEAAEYIERFIQAHRVFGG